MPHSIEETLNLHMIENIPFCLGFAARRPPWGTGSSTTHMEKKILPPAKLCHSFSFLFGDLKINLDRSEQARIVEMVRNLLHFREG